MAISDEKRRVWLHVATPLSGVQSPKWDRDNVEGLLYYPSPKLKSISVDVWGRDLYSTWNFDASAGGDFIISQSTKSSISSPLDFLLFFDLFSSSSFLPSNISIESLVLSTFSHLFFFGSMWCNIKTGRQPTQSNEGGKRWDTLLYYLIAPMISANFNPPVIAPQLCQFKPPADNFPFEHKLFSFRSFGYSSNHRTFWMSKFFVSP